MITNRFSRAFTKTLKSSQALGITFTPSSAAVSLNSANLPQGASLRKCFSGKEKLLAVVDSLFSLTKDSSSRISSFMDEKVWGFLAFGAFYACLVLLFVGARRAVKGNSFWATRALMTGGVLMFGGGTLVGLFVLLISFGDPGIAALTLASLCNLLILVGALIFLIGFFGFCARWGATGRRRAELLEITTALAAAKEQALREASTPETSLPETP